MDKQHVRQLVWEGLLDADYHVRYFGHLSGRLQARERYITIIVGVLSSGAFVTLIAKIQMEFLPQSLSLLSAIFSVVLANLKLGKAATLAASIHSKWATIRDRYEVLWGEIDTLAPEEASARWAALSADHRKEDETAAQEFRQDVRLAARCQADVFRTRRLVAT